MSSLSSRPVWHRLTTSLTVITLLLFVSMTYLPLLCNSSKHSPLNACSNSFPASALTENSKPVIYEALPDSRPWLALAWVSCERSGDNLTVSTLLQTCEGVLVRNNWVLTAATCLNDCKNLETASVTVDIGLQYSDIRKEMASGRKRAERITVERIYLKSSLEQDSSSRFPSNINNIAQDAVLKSSDVALLRLSKSVRDDNRVISLPDCSKVSSLAKFTEKSKLDGTSFDKDAGGDQSDENGEDRSLTNDKSGVTLDGGEDGGAGDGGEGSGAGDGGEDSGAGDSGEGSGAGDGGEDSKKDVECLVSSWGGPTNTEGALQDLRLRLLPHKECERISGDPLFTEGLICAEVSSQNASVLSKSADKVIPNFERACLVQRGTPLLIREEELTYDEDGTEIEKTCKWKLLGILSFGMGCHVNNMDQEQQEDDGRSVGDFVQPGFFTNVCHHLSWIETMIQQDDARVATISRCPVLPQPPLNGFICSGQHTTSGLIEFCCDKGYVINGRSFSECNSLSGRWEPAVGPECTSVKCPSLPPPKHGSSYPDRCEDSSYQTNCWFSCEPDYSLSQGTGLVTCGHKGEWSSPTPSCIPIECGPPPSTGSLQVSYTSTHINSTATYSCGKCFKMADGVNDNSEMICSQTSNWEGQRPVCKAVHCPPLTPPPFGSVQFSSLQCGAHVRFSCEPTFNLIGQSEAECLEDGTWSAPVPQCSTVACEAPLIPDSNYAQSNGSHAYGSVIRVECDKCRVMMVEGVRSDEDARTLTCMALGEWDKPIPTCQWVTCPLPWLVEHGTVQPLGQLYYCGTTVSFSCEDGYILNGTGMNTSVCTQNGTWSNGFLTCEEIVPPTSDLCPPPPSAQNNSHICAESADVSLTPGSVVSYCCDDGYVFGDGVGSGVLMCGIHRGWNGTTPACRPIKCPAPSLPPNTILAQVQLRFSEGHEYDYGNTSAREYHYGTRLTFGCDSVGSSVIGQKYTTCVGDRQWDHPVPTCEVTQCKAACESPMPPRNGRTASIFRPGAGILHTLTTNEHNGAIIGDVAVFLCNHGYYLHGSGSRKCDSNGVWSGQAPRCLPFDQPRSRLIFRDPIDNTQWLTTDSAHFLSHNPIYLACQMHLEGRALPIKKIDGPPIDRRNARSRVYGSSLRSTQLAIQPRNTIGGHSMAGVYLCQVQSISNASIVVNKTLTIHIHDVMCPIPSPLANGKLVTMGTTPGSCLHYECNRGHTLIGSNDRVCLSNGTWTGGSTQSYCVSTYNATCSVPPTDDHTSLTTPTSTTPTTSVLYQIGDTVTYACKEGYVLEGVATRVCLGGNRWDGVGPKCESESENEEDGSDDDDD